MRKADGMPLADRAAHRAIGERAQIIGAAMCSRRTVVQELRMCLRLHWSCRAQQHDQKSKQLHQWSCPAAPLNSRDQSAPLLPISLAHLLGRIAAAPGAASTLLSRAIRKADGGPLADRAARRAMREIIGAAMCSRRTAADV